MSAFAAPTPMVHLDTMATIEGVPLDNPLQLARLIVTGDHVAVWEQQTNRVWAPLTQVRGIDVRDATRTERRIPSWAVVVGIIGLFFFLIGVLFFFVRTDHVVPGTLVTVATTDGRVIRAYVAMPAGVVQGLLWPVTSTLAERATLPAARPGDPLPPPR